MDQLFINEGVFFRQYTNEMILVNTITQNICIVNSVAADLINIITEHGTITFSQLIAELIKEYRVDLSTLESDCKDTIMQLQNNHILNNGKETTVTHKEYNSPLDENDLEREFCFKMCKRLNLYSCLIELTYRCNLNCVHCFAKESSEEIVTRELTTSEIISLIDDLYLNKVFKLTFTGGEVFVREDAYEIIEYASKKGFLIDIFSNGTLIDENLIKKISALHPRSFQSSIYSYKPNMHDRITGQKGSFEKTISTLNCFSKHGVPINVKSILMNDTRYDYRGLEKLARSINATFQPGISISAKNNGSLAPLKYRIKEYTVIKDILLKMNNNSPQCNYDVIRTEDSSICGAGLSSLNVDPYGNVYPCNSFKYLLGNIRKQSIKVIWENSNSLKKIRGLTVGDLHSCGNCQVLNYCSFCPGMALSENNDMLKPYSEACHIAQLQAELHKNM